MQMAEIGSAQDLHIGMDRIEGIDLVMQRTQQILRDIEMMRSDGGLPTYICTICTAAQSSAGFSTFCCKQHSFCVGCIQSLTNHAIKEFKVARCPMEACERQFDEHSPYFQQLNQERKDKYAKILKNRSILTNNKLRLCSKPSCDGHYLNSASKLQCNICKQQYCSKCLQQAHEGRCDRLVARGMQKKYSFRRCPQCHMVVERQDGCDHMTCICAHQFCYKCGQSYIYGCHTCTKPAHLTGFASFRWEVERRPSALEGNRFSLSKILYWLQPSEEGSVVYRLVYTLLFSIFIYPTLSIMAISLCLLAATLYMGLAFIAITGYFTLLPIIEVSNLQLAPARFLKNKNIPYIIIRLLVLPLYPLNFLYGIKDKSDFLTCEGELPRGKSLLKIIGFFLALPFLINAESQ